MFDDSGVSSNLGHLSWTEDKNTTRHLHRDNKQGVNNAKGSAKKGADANTHGAHILPGCGDDNGDAHREILVVDTALPEHLCPAETGCAMSWNLTAGATEK